MTHKSFEILLLVFFYIISIIFILKVLLYIYICCFFFVHLFIYFLPFIHFLRPLICDHKKNKRRTCIVSHTRITEVNQKLLKLLFMGVCEIFEVVGLCYDIIDKRVKFSESGSFHVKSFEHFYILPCD